MMINHKITSKSIESILDHIDRSFYYPECDQPKHCYIVGGNYYEWYFTVAEYYKPASYFEIGVRFGYSMLAILAGAGGSIKRVQGYDNQCYVKDSNEKALENVNRFLGEGHDLDVSIDTQDTRELKTIEGFWDLAHVDGAHGYGGCQHDLKLLLGKAKIVMVDDYHTMCRKAVDDFIKENSDDIVSFYDLPTDRGMMVIEYKHEQTNDS